MYFLILVLFFSFGLTWSIRHYTLAKNIIDVPNHRSSHTAATPRGGGLAFVICFLVTIPFLIYKNQLTLSLGLTYFGSGFLIALIGFLDDCFNLPSKWRFLGHISIAILVLYGIGGMPSIQLVKGVSLSSGVFADILAIFFLCWLLNLYNFMDGIDGLASIEALTVCSGAIILYCLSGYYQQCLLPLILMAAIGGFLYWNFPPARIFMGDAGSSFLGFIFGVQALYSAQVQPQFFWSWLILLGVFIVDATFTLFRRLINGEKIYEAHRSHAYQYASRIFEKHLPVTIGVLIINIVWLLPLALIVGLGHLDPLVGVLIAYAPLSVLAFQFNAGRQECR